MSRAQAERLLEAYTNAPGAPGHEDAVRRLFHEELASASEQHAFSTDGSGSVMCRRTRDREDGPRVMLTAHMDEVGFMVQTITVEGFLRLAPLGGWWNHTLPGQGIDVITSDGASIPGCIGATPPHMLKEEDRAKVMELEMLYVDIGASSREEAMERFGVQLGDSVIPATRFTKLRNPDLLMAKAFDNRVGMALLTQLMQSHRDAALPCRLLGVATVQEEVGCRGAKTAAALARPDLALVLEGPPADDTPGANREEAQGVLGKGVQIRLLDPRAISSRRLSELAIQTAREKEIPHQVTVRRGGGTDASAIQLHDLGVPAVVLGVPARYIHSHHSIIHIDDYMAALDLVKALLERLDRETVEGLTRFLDE